MSTAVEALESASSRLASAVDDVMVAMNLLADVSTRISGEAHKVACDLADVHASVKRAADALVGAGA